MRALRKRRRAMRAQASTRVGGCDARGGRRDAVGGSSRREERGALGDGDDAEVVSPGRGGRGSKASTGSPRGKKLRTAGARSTGTEETHRDEGSHSRRSARSSRRVSEGADASSREGTDSGQRNAFKPSSAEGNRTPPPVPSAAPRRATAQTHPGGRRAWKVQNVETTVVIAGASGRSGARARSNCAPEAPPLLEYISK